jgi:hypothetical protein
MYDYSFNGSLQDWVVDWIGVAFPRQNGHRFEAQMAQ